MLELLRLNALLNGRLEVEDSDLKTLAYMVGIFNGETKEDHVYLRTLEETLRYFEVDPKLHAIMEAVTTAYDLTRAVELDETSWVIFARTYNKVPGRHPKLGKRSWSSLRTALDKLDITFSPLDDLRRGCLELLRSKI